VRAMRENVGSRAELARKLNVSPLTLSLWEQGDHAPRQTNARRLENLERQLARGGNGAKERRRPGAKKASGRVTQPRRRSRTNNAPDINEAVQGLLEVLKGAAMKDIARIDPEPLTELSALLSSLDDLRLRYEEWGATPWTEVEVQ
jgi:transcriptional regulator with XRE-family HTH domain